jgi:hypothetical protein
MRKQRQTFRVVDNRRYDGHHRFAVYEPLCTQGNGLVR